MTLHELIDKLMKFETTHKAGAVPMVFDIDGSFLDLQSIYLCAPADEEEEKLIELRLN